MSTTVRPDNLRAALDAKVAAAMSQLVAMREAEQPRITLHLNPREMILDAFLLYACRVYPIIDTFGREQAGDLQFDAWYAQWTERLGDADRVLWKQLRDERGRHELGMGAELIEVEISADSALKWPSVKAAGCGWVRGEWKAGADRALSGARLRPCQGATHRFLGVQP